jgi:hypothetical protein
MALYELAVLGSPTEEQINSLKNHLAEAATSFQLKVGSDITLSIKPATFTPSNRAAAAAIFFGGLESIKIDIKEVLASEAIPILPVSSTAAARAAEIPPSLSALNCLFYDQAGSDRVFTALLECIGLLPRQRRIFLSYRRDEATPAAVQLFSELSSRQFEVFLDTYSIGPAVEFQEVLWHQLCDVDVLIMLETPGYFQSRWTNQEFGRALAKSIGVLRVKWPDATPSILTGTQSLVELIPDEIDQQGHLANSAIDRICLQLEQVRTLSHATRHVSMVSSVQDAIERIEGKVDAIGPHRTMYLTLRNGKQCVVQPTIGVPSAVTLQETSERAGNVQAAVVYDHLGLKRSWQTHLDWLAKNVEGTKWVKVTDAAWDFAGWY